MKEEGDGLPPIGVEGGGQISLVSKKEAKIREKDPDLIKVEAEDIPPLAPVGEGVKPGEEVMLDPLKIPAVKKTPQLTGSRKK